MKNSLFAAVFMIATGISSHAIAQTTRLPSTGPVGCLPEYLEAKKLFEQASMPTEEEIQQLAGVYVARMCVKQRNYYVNGAVSIANSQYDKEREGFLVFHHSPYLNIGPTLKYKHSQVKVAGLLRYIQDIPLRSEHAWSSQRLQDETGIVPFVVFQGLTRIRVKNVSFVQGSYVNELEEDDVGAPRPIITSLRVDRKAQVFLTVSTSGSETFYCYDFTKVVSREELPQEMQ